MDRSHERSPDEFLAIFSLALVTGALSAALAVFVRFGSGFGSAPPLWMRAVLAARPLYALLFFVCGPASAVLFAEALRRDAGWAARMRAAVYSVLDAAFGPRAARAERILLGGATAGSALLLFVSVLAFSRPARAEVRVAGAPTSHLAHRHRAARTGR